MTTIFIHPGPKGNWRCSVEPRRSTRSTITADSHSRTVEQQHWLTPGNTSAHALVLRKHVELSRGMLHRAIAPLRCARLQAAGDMGGTAGTASPRWRPRLRQTIIRADGLQARGAGAAGQLPVSNRRLHGGNRPRPASDIRRKIGLVS